MNQLIEQIRKDACADELQKIAAAMTGNKFMEKIFNKGLDYAERKGHSPAKTMASHIVPGGYSKAALNQRMPEPQASLGVDILGNFAAKHGLEKLPSAGMRKKLSNQLEAVGVFKRVEKRPIKKAFTK